MEMEKAYWDLARESIKNGRTDEALESISSCCATCKIIHDSAYSFVGMALNRLVRSCGEEELQKLFRERFIPSAKNFISTITSAEEALSKMVEYHRGHFSEFTISDESDRYVLRLDPCGSGGRLMRGLMTVAEHKIPGMNIGRTKKAYSWSWGKSDICFYCIHCCIFLEILPIEMRGYPIAVVEYPDNTEDPCLNFFYKKPELIPEEYYARVGKTKTIR